MAASLADRPHSAFTRNRCTDCRSAESFQKKAGGNGAATIARPCARKRQPTPQRTRGDDAFAKSPYGLCPTLGIRGRGSGVKRVRRNCRSLGTLILNADGVPAYRDLRFFFLFLRSAFFLARASCLAVLRDFPSGGSIRCENRGNGPPCPGPRATSASGDRGRGPGPGWGRRARRAHGPSRRRSWGR